MPTTDLESTIKTILASRKRMTLEDAHHRPAAILLLLLRKDNDYHVLFTRRTEKLTHHKGQISFPGGACHGSDRTPLDTALRESQEEIGLAPGDVTVLGALDDTLTFVSNYRITPFVGAIKWPYGFRLNTAEAAELITIPLEALRDKMNFREETWVEEGIPVTVPFYTYRGRVIWGATARILKQFLSLLPSGQPA